METVLFDLIWIVTGVIENFQGSERILTTYYTRNKIYFGTPIRSRGNNGLKQDVTDLNYIRFRVPRHKSHEITCSPLCHEKSCRIQVAFSVALSQLS